MTDENKYLKELKKFEGHKVIVKTIDGEKFEGMCRGINYQHFNVVIMTEEEKIAIRNVAYMRRVRTKTKD